MFIVTFLLLVLSITQSIRADISVKDYVYWTKADISAWHQYFPSRLLEQERLTNQKATETVATLLDDIKTSLEATVKYQAQELETAQFMMEGTSAQGCVYGISTYMDKAIAEGVSYYQDCVADVIPSLKRLDTSWAKTNASYQAAYQRALTGIDSCVHTYPNRDSWSRLKTCVDSLSKNYFSMATTSSLYSSPAMYKFTYFAASCAQTAASGVVSKGWTFLKMLVQCAKLSENVDSVIYEQQLTSEFYKYTTMNDLTSQIWKSQMDIAVQVQNIEQEMLRYYEIERRALEKYVIESRNQSYYHGQMIRYLQKYLDTVSSTSVDNPANVDCIAEANYALNNIINIGSAKALECDVEIVENTKLLIAQVNDMFLQINSILPYSGNVAIISCFGEGYIFAENTISNCFSLSLNGFNINITELNTKIVDDVNVLQGYEESFFSNSSLPCGNFVLSKAFLEADRALYNLQRCLYIGTGTKYDVTTYASFTTSASKAYTDTTPTPTTGYYTQTPTTEPFTYPPQTTTE